MTKISKNRKLALSKYDATKSYSLAEAAKIVKEITNTKFDSSVEISVRLGVDPRKSDQVVRSSTLLPKGTGKVVRVGVFAQGELAEKGSHKELLEKDGIYKKLFDMQNFK